MMETIKRRLQLRPNYMEYAKIELQLVLKEWKVLLPCLIMQYVHGIFHNVAYWMQANKLSVEQRFALHDLGFSLMPELSETSSHASEYLVFGAVFAPAILLVLSVAVLKPNPKRPRFVAIILKRVLLQISIALVFRICSFMLTTLPAPARQCRLNFDDACLAKYPDEPTRCVIPNPEFKPPSGADFFLNMDALKGCGDLMFSSHTIYTLSFILTISKYWPYKPLIALMVSVQIAIAFLIVASRKHYSLDVFTALYVVPAIWFLQEAYMKDINHKDTSVSNKTVYEFYQIDVSTVTGTNDGNVQLETTRVSLVEQGQTNDQEGNVESSASYQRKTSL
ncbi:hypothetical protein Poli38472_009117 [Pythium oligandrum]|uniref:Sphingomyelin synthase-like domain-containing protein n=1 Tax=Pythium oligandrum TaxID=41045 RepID=A0A8K1FIG2_PYTOL|nr:hypothetical protein Poli38472_009117 [Pythium oligandrum]|eukprot:TMW64950.1 hypothetical protein Poli38472_009117 [Pythium oligandrum]